MSDNKVSHQLSQKEKIKLINDLNNETMRQTMFVYGGIILTLIIAIIIGRLW